MERYRPPVTRRVLVISGSTRHASTNSALVRTAAACAPASVAVAVYEGLAKLPHFNPDDDRDPLPPLVTQLRSAIADADALLFCTPEYAGTLPGSLKNLLDWTVGGTQMSEKPVAWVNAAADPRRGGGARDTLRMVLGYVQASIVEAACRHVAVPSSGVGADGLIADGPTRAQLADVLTVLVEGVPPTT